MPILWKESGNDRGVGRDTSQVRLYLHVDFAEDYITEHYTG